MKMLGRCGYTVTELLMVTSLVTSIPAGSYVTARKKANDLFCRNNLSQIEQAIIMYTVKNSNCLPDAIFYPEKPDDPRGINNILKNFCGKKVFICRSLPEELQKTELTYLWNDEFSNGIRRRIKNAREKWLMVDISAVAPKLPPPHRGGYHILYVDGHIEQSKVPPTFFLEK